ncbi:hypothetical protein M231_04558 [Tremella mesenterica]|uniref:Serine carboxypeptidase n=1 Tax=Tremella mesenterica TaxID=5217 RepID=A0A4Q1BKB4_TREME|nr:hypothetical protein M231_04558 [Tremella mesenterica]
MLAMLPPLLLLSILTHHIQARLSPEIDHLLLRAGRPRIGLWQALSRQEQRYPSVLTSRSSDGDTGDLKRETQVSFGVQLTHYKAYCFTQPVSHFDPTITDTFCQRYWIDASSYEEGGPVFVLDGGETSGEDRLLFLKQGILQILSNATNGLSIVLEHRYYGESQPVPSLTTDNLRFLNNEEALEDSAEFIRNFKIPSDVLKLSDEGILQPDRTPWIYYGGSYAGARAAHMRVGYPDIVYGAIGSSAVTHAQVDFHQYYDPIKHYASSDCIAAVRSSIKIIDQLLYYPEPVPTDLKAMFGLDLLGDAADFADVLQSPLGNWQSQNWDPTVGSDEFQQFCDALLSNETGVWFDSIYIPSTVVNYGKYINDSVVSQCPRDTGDPATDLENCFGTQNDAQFQVYTLDQTWRLWLFQVCTQWGYFMPAPAEGASIVSELLTLEYTSKICHQAFPPGDYYQVPQWPDVESVNRRGDYGIRADRLAFIDGDRDPWRPVTPQSDSAPTRVPTVNEPRRIIYNAVHHYDENGLSDHSLEPKEIKEVHAYEVDFVKQWVEEWKATHVR